MPTQDKKHVELLSPAHEFASATQALKQFLLSLDIEPKKLIGKNTKIRDCIESSISIIIPSSEDAFKKRFTIPKLERLSFGVRHEFPAIQTTLQALISKNPYKKKTDQVTLVIDLLNAYKNFQSSSNIPLIAKALSNLKPISKQPELADTVIKFLMRTLSYYNIQDAIARDYDNAARNLELLSDSQSALTDMITSTSLADMNAEELAEYTSSIVRSHQQFCKQSDDCSQKPRQFLAEVTERSYKQTQLRGSLSQIAHRHHDQIQTKLDDHLQFRGKFTKYAECLTAFNSTYQHAAEKLDELAAAIDILAEIEFEDKYSAYLKFIQKTQTDIDTTLQSLNTHIDALSELNNNTDSVLTLITKLYQIKGDETDRFVSTNHSTQARVNANTAAMRNTGFTQAHMRELAHRRAVFNRAESSSDSSDSSDDSDDEITRAAYTPSVTTAHSHIKRRAAKATHTRVAMRQLLTYRQRLSAAKSSASESDSDIDNDQASSSKPKSQAETAADSAITVFDAPTTPETSTPSSPPKIATLFSRTISAAGAGAGCGIHSLKTTDTQQPKLGSVADRIKRWEMRA